MQKKVKISWQGDIKFDENKLDDYKMILYLKMV